MGHPLPYDLQNPKEMERLFREVRGYLRTDIQAGYGTDTKGRQYAIDALDDLVNRPDIAQNGRPRVR